MTPLLSRVFVLMVQFCCCLHCRKSDVVAVTPHHYVITRTYWTTFRKDRKLTPHPPYLLPRLQQEEDRRGERRIRRLKRLRRRGQEEEEEEEEEKSIERSGTQ